MEMRRLAGWNIRRLRVMRGISIETLAGDAGVADTSLARLERGQMNVSLDFLDKLARALKVKPAQLFEPLSSAPTPLRSGRRKKPVRKRAAGS